MATKLPPKPTNKLEEIMCDADLDYLGQKRYDSGFQYPVHGVKGTVKD